MFTNKDISNFANAVFGTVVGQDRNNIICLIGSPASLFLGIGFPRKIREEFMATEIGITHILLTT